MGCRVDTGDKTFKAAFSYNYKSFIFYAIGLNNQIRNKINKIPLNHL